MNTNQRFEDIVKRLELKFDAFILKIEVKFDIFNAKLDSLKRMLIIIKTILLTVFAGIVGLFFK